MVLCSSLTDKSIREVGRMEGHVCISQLPHPFHFKFSFFQMGKERWLVAPPLTQKERCKIGILVTGSTASNKIKYVCPMKDWLRLCKGVMIWRNGDRYVGEWNNDTMNGHGTLCMAHGGKYEGDWQHGLVWNLCSYCCAHFSRLFFHYGPVA